MSDAVTCAVCDELVHVDACDMVTDDAIRAAGIIPGADADEHHVCCDCIGRFEP